MQPQQQQNVAPGHGRQAVVVCHNRTMAEFWEDLHQLAGGYLTSPVMDSTGLKGSLGSRNQDGPDAASWPPLRDGISDLSTPSINNSG